MDFFFTFVGSDNETQLQSIFIHGTPMRVGFPDSAYWSKSNCGALDQLFYVCEEVLLSNIENERLLVSIETG